MFSSLGQILMPPATSKGASAAGSLAGRRADKRSERQTDEAPAKTATAASSPGRAKKPPPSIRTTAPPDESTDAGMASNGEKTGAATGPDTFENEVEAEESTPPPPRASVDLDELPIELIGLTDSFIESLQAKVHATPPNIDKLSQRFQDFYASASSHIATHLAALATRQNRAWQEKRQPSPPPATPARASTASILRAKAAASIGGSNRERARTTSAQSTAPHPPSPSTSTPESAEQQMVTSDELAMRRKARRALEQKRILMEEAVERRLCEGIYDRIYRHRTTQDEAQDEKLRSKTAALDVVGIGLADLGVDLGVSPSADPAAVAEKAQAVREWLEPARAEIQRMGQTHYPLGKLNRLKAAHKAIVDTLAHFHPSASADEIMPMLIYTLITQPPEQLNVVSDLNFIQRFRWEPKMEGEAAYCLTNLEAAISFLETVDLSTLRADEEPSGPAKTAHAGVGGDGAETPKTETFPPAYTAQQGLAVPTAATPSAPEISDGQATGTLVKTTTVVTGAKPGVGGSLSPTTPTGLRAAVQLRNRRLSDLVNTPAGQAISSASDAVMNTFSAADQGLKTIGNSLEGSYRLFFGRLGQQGQKGPDADTAHGAAGGPAAAAAAAAAATTTGDGAADGTADLLLPKTLDEARKLVTTPPSVASEDEDASVTEEEQQQHPKKTVTAAPGLRPLRRRDTDKMLLLVGGRKASGGGGGGGAVSRDHSADSTRSRRSTATADDHAVAAPSTAPAANPALLLDSVRNLGSSFNPMSRLSGFGGSLRGLGRTVSTPAPANSGSGSGSGSGAAAGGDLATAFPELAGALPPKAAPHVAPPVKRFMELHNPGDLRLGEVMELLRDYRRLATALKDMGAFKG